jgi:DNA-binding transcriptional regulator GbsR (MarR family)
LSEQLYSGFSKIRTGDTMATPQFILRHIEPTLNPSSDELAGIIIHRMGLMPRKKGSTERMHRILIELYEKSKQAGKEKKPSIALMTVEEMGLHAGISRQTMYDYIKRWQDLDLISKTSYIGPDQKVVVGYKLNGSTLENAFGKAKTRILNNLDLTAKYVGELQKVLKNEKISRRFDEKRQKGQKTIAESASEENAPETGKEASAEEAEMAAVLSQFF